MVKKTIKANILPFNPATHILIAHTKTNKQSVVSEKFGDVGEWTVVRY